MISYLISLESEDVVHGDCYEYTWGYQYFVDDFERIETSEPYRECIANGTWPWKANPNTQVVRYLV